MSNVPAAKVKKTRKTLMGRTSRGHILFVDSDEVSMEASENNMARKEFYMGCCQWALSVQRYNVLPNGTTPEVNYLQVRLTCMNDGSHDFCVATSGKFSILKDPRKEGMQGVRADLDNIEEAFAHKFNMTNSYREVKRFAPISHLAGKSSPFLFNNKFTVRLKLRVVSVKKSLYPRFVFDAPSAFPLPSGHVCISVVGKDGKKKSFHVEKSVLAIHCKYFATMFDPSKAEMIESTQGVVELKVASRQVFASFLRVIHPSREEISDKLLVGLLTLANYLQCPMVLALCEEFLLNVRRSYKFKFQEKFFLADKFNLDRLKAHLMRRLVTKEQISQLMEQPELKEITIAMLKRKAEMNIPEEELKQSRDRRKLKKKANKEKRMKKKRDVPIVT